MPKIEVMPEVCKRCEYCVKVCPKQCLKVGDKSNSKGFYYVVPQNEDACISCKMCVTMCPDAAIKLYK